MKRQMAWVRHGVLAAVAAGAEDPAQALARGKLEADLGHHAVAAEAFASVAQAPQATAPQRWEALVRLGVARRDAGDAKGAPTRSRRPSARYGKDPEALRFLLQAVGSALPGRERWEEVWNAGDRRRGPAGARPPPGARRRGRGSRLGLCPCSGTPVDLDFTERRSSRTSSACSPTPRA